MAVITLTTDMGLKDYYEASVKGVILTHCPKARIVDISHDVTPFDIAQAAFILRNTFEDFPKGTIHIIGVDPDSSADKAHAIVQHKGHYFIAADNGIFSLLFDTVPEQVYHLSLPLEKEELTFPTKHVFIQAACHIINGGSLDSIGNKVSEVREKARFRATVPDGNIRGMVIYIDSYGNVITNITRDLFEEVGQGRKFSILFRRSQYSINKISETYSDVDEGDKVALFGSTGFLEIAIYKGAKGAGGGANSLFGLKINDLVTIEFK